VFLKTKRKRNCGVNEPFLEESCLSGAISAKFVCGGGEGLVVRILVVDDNPAVRRYLRAILEQQTSWRVVGEAHNGAEAMEQVCEVQPDLILLDHQMPDLNGVDVARQIARTFPKIPILMVTLHLSNQLAEAARQAGIKGACAKQDIGSVVEAVEVLLHQETYFKTIPGETA
jgi:DNA-binding NarL/FixJ family response regulator